MPSKEDLTLSLASCVALVISFISCVTGVMACADSSTPFLMMATNAPIATVAAVTAVMIAKIGFTAMDAVQRAVTTEAALTPML